MANKMDIKSLAVTIPVDANTGNAIIVLDCDLELFGFHLFPVNPIFGDTGKMEILDPQDTIIGVYGDGVHVPLINHIFVKGDIYSPAEIPRGFKIKFTYSAVDTNGRQCMVWLQGKRQ